MFGHYTQDGIIDKGELKVIEVVQEIGEYITLKKGQKLTASQLCERFLFDGHQQYSYVSTLSGGEKRRLFLLTILMKNPNFLILDEPTNDLDILTLQALEEFLDDFPGCLLVVSHDRYFLDKLCDHLFVFEGGGRIKDFNGHYYEWREEQKRIDAIRVAQEKAGSRRIGRGTEGKGETQLQRAFRVGIFTGSDCGAGSGTRCVECRI